MLLYGIPSYNALHGLEIQGDSDHLPSQVAIAPTPYFVRHVWDNVLRLDDPVIESAAKVARSIEWITSVSQEKDSAHFKRLVRGLVSWGNGIQSVHGGTRLHAFVRSIETFINSDVGRGKRQFVDRCAKLVNASGLSDVLAELYDLRSHEEHLNDWEKAVGGRDTQTRVNRGTLRVYQAELLASSIFLRVFLNPVLMQLFRDDGSVQEFWSSSYAQSFWGEPIDLDLLVRRRMRPIQLEQLKASRIINETAS